MLKCAVALVFMLTIAPSVLAQAAKDAVAIEDARAPAVTDTRTVNLPVYMTIRNRSDKDERLLAATTPYADRVELIELRNEIGINLPMAADVLLLAPGTSLDLDPLGPRLLLSGLKTPLKAVTDFPSPSSSSNPARSKSRCSWRRRPPGKRTGTQEPASPRAWPQAPCLRLPPRSRHRSGACC